MINVEGLCETTEKTFCKYGISTAMKPYRTLRQLLVQPKTQRTVDQTGESLYRIPCYSCDCITFERLAETMERDEEHRKEVELISNKIFTRSDRKSTAAEMNKSAVTDHAAKENHVINWSGAKILERKGRQKTRHVKELI